MRVARLAARYCRSVGLRGVIPFALVTIVLGFSATRLEVGTSFGHELPPSVAPDAAERLVSERFATDELVLVSLPSATPFAVDALVALQVVHRDLESIDLVQSVTSVASASDLEVDADEVRFVSLLEDPVDAASALRLEARIAAVPLFRNHLLSSDGSAWSLWVVPRPGADARLIAADIERVVARYPGAVAYGNVLLDASIYDALRRESVLVVGIALVVAFAVFFAIARHWGGALLLWVASVVPTVWVVGLFPIVGEPLSIYSLPIPLLVLAISTSYSIHLFRYRSTFTAQSMEQIVERVSPTITVAASTTGLGLATLFLSSFPLLRSLGLLLLAGVVFAFVCAVFGLPVALARYTPRLVATRDPVRRPARWRPSLIPVLGLAVVLPVVAIGVGRSYTSSAPESLLRASDPVVESRRRIGERHGGVDPIDIFIDTRAEYGLVDPVVYASIHRFVESLRARPHVHQVIAFTDVVNWITGRFAGDDRMAVAHIPQSDVEIGEAFELLSGVGGRFSVRALVDGAYSSARVTILLPADADPRGAAPRLEALVTSIEADAARMIPSATTFVTGYRVERDRLAGLLVGDQTRSVVVFFASLVVLLFALYRSWRWVAIALVPSIASVVLFYGLAGWTGLALNAATATVVATIMGVSVDDVVYLTLFYRRERLERDALPALRDTLHHAGRAAFQTTFIICVSVLPIALSRFASLLGHAILLVLSLSVATFCTLRVVPWFMLRADARRTDRKLET